MNSRKLGVSISDYIKENESLIKIIKFRDRSKSFSRSISPGRTNCYGLDESYNGKFRQLYKSQNQNHMAKQNSFDELDHRLGKLNNVNSAVDLRDLRREIINKYDIKF